MTGGTTLGGLVGEPARKAEAGSRVLDEGLVWDIYATQERLEETKAFAFENCMNVWVQTCMILILLMLKVCCQITHGL